MIVAYVAHQLSGNIEANRAAASKWVTWTGLVGLAPQATWIVLSGEWTEEEGRDLGLQIDCALIERCDVLLLVGPRVSEGMSIERDHAMNCGKLVVDLTGYDFDTAERVLARVLREAGMN